MQRELLIIGLVFIVAALAWPWLGKLPLGRLPGDISYSRPGFQFFMPLTTMLIVSIVVSFLFWLFRR